VKDFSKNLHVLLVQETEGWKGTATGRPAYPPPARMHGKGASSTPPWAIVGCWTSERFQGNSLRRHRVGRTQCGCGRHPNLDQAAPRANELPPPTPPAHAGEKKAKKAAKRKAADQ